MSSDPLPAGFVAAVGNLAVCTLCGGHMPRSPQNIQEHVMSAKHRTAIAQQQQQQNSQHVAAAAAAAASSSAASLSTDGGLGDSELELQLLAQKHKYALEKFKMEQEMEQMKLRQRILEKQQAEEEAAIIARLAQLKMHTQTQTSTPTQASKAGAGLTSPPGFTQPRAAAAAASSLSLTPNPAPRVYAPTAPASAPAARPPASAAAAAPSIKAALAAAAPSGRFSKPGLYQATMVGVLTKWKGKIFGVIEMPADQAIDGQTIFQFHINQLMPGVDRAQLTVGSHVEFRIWVNAERRLFANCVQPAGEEGRAARVSAKAEAPMEPGSSQPSDDEDDGQSDRSGEEGAAPFTTVTHRKHAAVSAAAASPSASSSAVSSSKLAPGRYDRMIGKLQSFASPRGLILLPADRSINGTREVCVHESQLQGTIAVGSTVSFQLFVNPTLKLFANEVRPVAQAAAGAALTPLSTPVRVVHKTLAPGGPASPDASPVRASDAATAPSAGQVDEFAAVQCALRLMVAKVGKELIDVGSVALEILQRHRGFKESLGEGGWMALWRRVHAAGAAELVVTLGPTGDKVYHLRLVAKPVCSELNEVRTALESLTAHGGDLIDVGPVAMQIMKRNPGFKERLGDGGWMALWKRAHAAGVVSLEITLSQSGAKVYHLRRRGGQVAQQPHAQGAAVATAAAPQSSEFSEIQSALVSMTANMGGDLFDQASVAEWMGRRNPQLKEQLAGGGWLALWKRADAAGAVKLETRVGPTGVPHYSLRLTRGPQIHGQGAASAAATPQRAESSSLTSSQVSASTTPASASSTLATPPSVLVSQVLSVLPSSSAEWTLVAHVGDLFIRLTGHRFREVHSRSIGEFMHQYPQQFKLRMAANGHQSVARTTDAATTGTIANGAQGAGAVISSPAKPQTKAQAAQSPADGSSSSQADGGLSELEQFHLRKQQRLDVLRRAQEELEQEEHELRQRQSTQQTSMDETDEEAEARRVEQEQAEIEAAFAELSSPPEAPVAPAAPLTQWTSLASSLASQPVPSVASASAPASSSSSSSSSSVPPVPAGLLRGTFIRWLDGKTYGVVSYAGGKETLCHVDQISCEASDLTRGCAVQFVLHRGKGRDYAEAVQPLGWSLTRGLDPGHCRGVIAHWVDATQGLIRARVHGLQREMILFHVGECGALSPADLPEHTKVTFKPVVNPHNNKTFAHEVRPIKANSAARDHNDQEDNNDEEER